MVSKYYSQEEEHTCGPACMRMALGSFGISKSEQELVSVMKTTKNTGTKRGEFGLLAKKQKLKYFEKGNSTFEELKELKRKGYIIILNYFYQPHKEGHYAVLKKIDSDSIYLLDPWVGPNHKYSLPYFSKIWYSNQGKVGNKRWFFAIKK